MDEGTKIAVVRANYAHKDFLIGVAGLAVLGLYSMTVGPLAQHGGPADFAWMLFCIVGLVVSVAVPRVEVYERRVDVVWLLWRHRVPREEIRGIWVREHHPPRLLVKTEDDTEKGWVMQLDRQGVIRLVKLIDAPLLGDGPYLETWRRREG